MLLGWRGRIGYVAPSAVRLPWEMQELLPEGVVLLATSLRVRSYTDAEFDAARAAVAEAVGYLVEQGAQGVLLAGVPIAVREGYAREQEWLEKLRATYGVPVISGIAASVEGFRHRGVRQPLVATLYLEGMNAQIAAYLTEAGMPPAALSGMGSRSPAESSRMDAGTLYHVVREQAAAHPGADGVFLGARVDLQEVATALEADLGLPVLHASQAGLWWLLRAVRIAGPAEPGGRAPAP